MKLFNTSILLTINFFFIVTLVHASQQSNEDQILLSILNDYEAFYLTSNPFHQLEVGGNNKKLPDLSEDNLAKNHQQRVSLIDRLKSINIEDLSTENEINRAVLLYSLKNKIDEYRFKAHYTPLTAESGFHVKISTIALKVNFNKLTDYEDYLSRLETIPRYFSQQIEWMKKGLEEGYSQPKVVLIGFEESIAAFIKADVTESVYYKPFTHFSRFIEVKQQKVLKQKRV
jgi:uncharacterized protein (DUF885 family)